MERARGHLRGRQGNREGSSAGQVGQRQTWKPLPAAPWLPSAPSVAILTAHLLTYKCTHLWGTEWSAWAGVCVGSLTSRAPALPLGYPGPQPSPATEALGVPFVDGTAEGWMMEQGLGERPEDKQTWVTPILQRRQVRPSHTAAWAPSLLPVYLLSPDTPSALGKHLPRPGCLRTRVPAKSVVNQPQGKGGVGPGQTGLGGGGGGQARRLRKLVPHVQYSCGQV